MKRALHNILILATAAILTACGGGADSTTGGAPTVATTGSLTGIVRDTSTALALAGASVTTGGISSTTAADGTYTLTGLTATDNAIVVVNKTGYAQGFAMGKVVANTTNQANANLTAISSTGTIVASTGGTVTVANSTAAVLLPANGIVTASGSAVTGNVTVELGIIDPASNPASMPGNYTASVGTGTAMIESFGALEVTLKDANGAKLNLAAGKTATIRIPVNTRSSNLPATIPLFYFNENTGLWVEEGSATLQGIAPNQFYEGTVSHFSTWNADSLYQSIYISGCVKDASGSPVAGQMVRTSGKDYSGTATVFTNADGTFRVAGKRNGTLDVFTVNNVEYLINTPTHIAPTAVDVSLPQCLTVPAVVPPVISTQPVSLTAFTPGCIASFSVAATGVNLRYQWYKNGVAIPGETRSHLIINGCDATYNASVYTVKVTAVSGSSTTSSGATLTVATAASITTQPQSSAVVVGQTATFSVAAVGTASITYQWYKNGAAISGATTASYTTPTTTLADNGAAYSVIVTGPANSVTSINATLTVTQQGSAAAIVIQPVATFAAVGIPATFTVVATGTGLQYQWRKNGINIAGATQASFTSPNTTAADNGAVYSVLVSNAGGVVTSGNAALTVLQNGVEEAGKNWVQMALLPTHVLDVTSYIDEFMSGNYAAYAPCNPVYSGSATLTSDGVTLPFDSAYPLGAHTLQLIANNCKAYSDEKYNGTVTANYNLSAVDGDYMRGQWTSGVSGFSYQEFDSSQGAVNPPLVKNIFVTGSLSQTSDFSTAPNAAAGSPIKTGWGTWTINPGATVFSQSTGLTATFQSASGTLNSSTAAGSLNVSTNWTHAATFIISGNEYKQTHTGRTVESAAGIIQTGQWIHSLTKNGLLVGYVVMNQTAPNVFSPILFYANQDVPVFY